MKIEPKIDKGYVCIARQITNSEIMLWNPLYFKLWVCLIAKANFQTVESKGQVFNRGECLVTYDEMIEMASYYVGWRKEKPSKSVIGNFLEKAREHGMIITRKTTVGLYIFIVNYDYYQTVTNYEYNDDSDSVTTETKSETDIINKNDKNEEKVFNDNEKIIGYFENKLKRKCATGEREVLDKLVNNFGDEEVKKKIDYVSNKGIAYISANYVSAMFKNTSPAKKTTNKSPFVSCGLCNEGGHIFVPPNLYKECQCHVEYRHKNAI